MFLSSSNFRMIEAKYNNGSNISSTILNTKDQLIDDEIRQTLITSQTILLFLVYFTGLYLRFFNSIRRKSAFLKLVKNAECKNLINRHVQIQNRWIEAIMPSTVKDEYLKNIRQNKEATKMTYFRLFDNVSILFADIVGFTALCSNKTAEHLVQLLNDLYHRFDEYTKQTNCEKLGTLGDCYYCVSGCPIPRPDHALCCVEMGIGMCRLILRFNKDHNERVNMRVGVHTGRVMAAIVGNHRFRFDVFSYDVIIANSLETTGCPGEVHVSEDTYKLIRHAHVVRDGEPLEVIKEEAYGISGMIQKHMFINTYFVIPPTTQKKRTGHDSNYNAYFNMSNSRKLSSKPAIPFYSNLRYDNTNLRFEEKDAKMKGDLHLIRTIQRDPERPAELFVNLPINPFFLWFHDKEIERQYLYHTTDEIKPIYLYSNKIALLIDSVACFIFCNTMIAIAYILYDTLFILNNTTFILYFIGTICVINSIWVSVVYKSEINQKLLRVLFVFCNHPVLRCLSSIYLSTLPSLIVNTLGRKETYDGKYENITMDLLYKYVFFSLSLFAMIGNCIFCISYSFLKNTVTFACLLYFLYHLVLLKLKTKLTSLEYLFGLSCRELAKHTGQDSDVKYFEVTFLLQFLQLIILIFYLTQENERNIRLHFYASREAEIRNDEAKRAKRLAELLLYNIIPKHVFAEIMGNRTVKKAKMQFHYAHGVECGGIVFACISNFFSSYYREDYKNGEVALRILHQIISMFDAILQRPHYIALEKIKTINDCYMLASGVNSSIDTAKDDDHLFKLMHFAFEMQHNLHMFNVQNMIGGNVFRLKIGYNYGPITAGIIGTTKPLYDIWGDAVNVASRMYSTAPPGAIQVPENVIGKLERAFHFEYRGEIPIKGKGQMRTYLARKLGAAYRRYHYK